MMGSLSRYSGRADSRTFAERARPLIVAAALFVPLLVPILLAAPARAAGQNPRAEAKVEVERAEVQYKLGRFDEALEGYSRAYELVNAPGLLFNIGQCHKNLKSYERAIFFFQEYLREETRPERRTLANELIAEARAEMERQRVSPPSPSESASEGGVAPPSVPTWREPPVGEEADAPSKAAPSLAPAAPSDVPLTRKWWFWTAVAAGAAVIATGAIVLAGSGASAPPAGSVGTLDRRQ